MRKFLFLTSMLVLIGVASMAQRTVTGQVKDPNGNPIAGASVLVQGTSVGTVTNEAGNFTINVPGNNRVLIVSAVGMATQRVNIGAETNVEISLLASEQALQEVVVTGYGTQQRRSFTGSSAKVNPQQISTLMTPSVDKELAGRAAGVQVTNSSGTINAPATIRIRGIQSINQSNQPLIVVDGAPIIQGNLSATTNSNALADINPADIESIEVLKDGAALNIYGSRGAAGVIQITTKRGQRGQLRMNYDGFVGFSTVGKRYELLNADQFVTIANEKSSHASNPATAPKAGINPGGVNTDWQNEVLVDNAPVTNQNISIAGGSNRSTYYMSLNYASQQGVIKTNWNKAYRIRANVDNEINNFIRIGNNITLSRQENTDQNTGTNSLGGAIASSLRLLPNVSPYDPNNPTGYNVNLAANNIPNGPNSQGVDANWFNVPFVLNFNKYHSEQHRIIDNAFIELSPVQGLKLRSQFQYDLLTDYAFQEWDPRHGDGYSSNGLVYNADQNFSNMVWSNYFNYNLNLNSHNFFLTGGYELSKGKTKWLSSQGTNIADLFYLQKNLISNSASTPSVGGNYSESGLESFFGRFNYDFRNRYFAQVSFRRDGQSSLAPGKKYGNFPGFSIGWRPSEEYFWRNAGGLSHVLSDVKIKASYATVGNPLGGLPYLSTFGAAPYGNISGIAVNAIGNTELQWETSKKYDVGLEIGFLRGRINLTTDWFMNNIDNLVLFVPTPLSAGIPGNSIPQNIGSMQNKGIEFAVDAAAIRGKDFTWNVNLNFSSVRNEVQSLYSIGGNPTQFINNGSYNIIRVGDPINILYGYRYAGVNTANGFPMYYKADGKLVVRNVSNGAYYFIQDANDGTIAAANQTSLSFADRANLGEVVPTWYGGINNSFGYKGFGLEFLLRYSGGNKIMNITRQEALLDQSFVNNGVEILQRWQKPGDVATVPKLVYNQSNIINDVGLATSRFVESGDYLRLQNVILTYTIGSSSLKKISNGRVQNIRLYAQGQNLHVWTNYSGADPDNHTSAGLENPGLPPQIRTISFGLNIGF